MIDSKERIIQVIKLEYEAGETTYLGAIEEIQKRCGHTPIEAETIVIDWDKAEEDGGE